MFPHPVEVAADDATACADDLAASVLEVRLAGARRLARVARWADLNAPAALASGSTGRRAPTGRLSGLQGAWAVGSDGTPQVAEFAVVELGMLLNTSTRSAECLLRDALDLRHRFPRLWEAVMAGGVDDWKARKVAAAGRRLTQDQARWVDEDVVEALIGLPFGRAMSVVEGKVIAADPEGHQARLAEHEQSRYVSTGRRSNTFGLRTLVAQSTAGDIARLEAMTDHLASLMEQFGDTDSADVRRAKALALLANPALACLLLLRGQDETAGQAGADEVDEPRDPSAVELGAAVGQMLVDLGPGAIDRLRPRTVLYLHVAEEAVRGAAGCQVARVEDHGPIGIDQLREWLGHDRVVVRPVFDPAGQEPVDSYEVPSRLREANGLLHPFETFPWGTLSARSSDQDHVRPYDPGGPPGQTSLDNLEPLSRQHHRAKTFGGFICSEPIPGLYLWRTPTGHWFRVDHQGSTPLGRSLPTFVQRLASARPAVSESPAERQFRTHVDLAFAS